MSDTAMRGILLISDIDGTLVTSRGMIPERNITAIRRFVEKGGRFTFATGRSVMGTLKFAAQVPVNAPIITYNGGCIYDTGTNTTLWNSFLAPASVQLIREVNRLFPDVGIEVYSSQHVYSVNRNSYTKAHIAFGNLTEFERSTDDIPENLNKILFSCDNERLSQVAEYLRGLDHAGCVYVFSGPIYFEVLPAGVSKGATAGILAELLGIGADRLVSIGDYTNDLELLAVSALSAAPGDALDAVKSAADVVVCDCEDGAVADFIEYLEDRFG